MPPDDVDTALWAALTGDDPDRAGHAERALATGADPNARDANGLTPLIRALALRDARLSRLLLQAGSDVHAVWNTTNEIAMRASRPHGYPEGRRPPRAPRPGAQAGRAGRDAWRAQPTQLTAAAVCADAAIARLLLDAGADFQDFARPDGPLMELAGVGRIPATPLTEDQLRAGLAIRYGTTNPEPCDNPVWREQIRHGFGGLFRTADGQWDSDAHHAFLYRNRQRPYPMWCFDRYGRSATRLPDRRIVMIAGEHEDSYDPDFHIYNDVTVFDGAGGVQHYIYPREVFPPTDFHTATLTGGAIWLIGCLGYPKQRIEGTTQVLRLDLDDFSISPVRTSGDAPGWIWEHRARREGRRIVVSGGKLHPEETLDAPRALDLDTLAWARL